MKKLLLNLIIATFSFVSVAQQQPQGDIIVANPTISPAPGMVGQSGTVSCTIIHTSGNVPPQSLQGFGAFTISDEPLELVMKLKNVGPANPLLPLSGITIVGDGNPTVSYDATGNIYKFTQTTSMADGDGFQVTIPIIFTATTPSSNPQNGFFANFNKPIYFNETNNSNDFAAVDTYTSGVLPINLTSFSGMGTDCETVLRWKTDNEKNFDRFEVEYSTDGSNFVKVGDKAGSRLDGGSSYEFNYTQTGPKGLYRLKMINIDGKFNYSGVVTVYSNCKNPKASIYPNPITLRQDATVTLSNYSGKIMGYLIDAAGKQLSQVTLFNGTNTLKLATYASGNYMLRILDEEKNTGLLKIIIGR